jgi:phosphatidylethanolamine-binding protein (PEBP) family uncharacterized protein
MKRSAVALLVALLAGLTPSFAASKSITFVADIWADNWFAMYVNGKLVGQDSVPITTTKSFNKETITFTATYPLTIGFIAKDYVENNSGLEYIGAPNQQIGDGGFIAQVYEKASQKFVTATDKTWKSYVLFKAPLNPECASSSNPLKDCRSSILTTPTSWNAATFKDSAWKTATEFSKEEVGVKDGYLQVNWDTSAKLIWSSDLKLDNTILFRKVVSTPTAKTLANLAISIKDAVNLGLPRDVTCDGAGAQPTFLWSGLPTGTQSIAITMETIPGPPRPGELNTGNHYMLVAYDLPPSATSMSGATYGLNFQNRIGYTPPCSQGPGLKTYTVTIFALDQKLSPSAPLDGSTLLSIARSHLIAKSSVDYSYARS